MLTPPLNSPDVQLALRAAREGAAVIRRMAADPSGFAVRTKQPRDFVTAVDFASERAVVDALLAQQPGDAVLSEEQGPLHGNPSSSRRWILDPVDGTTNLIHGLPAYAVSLALAVEGRLEVGVVHDVPHDEVFVAERGRGAWRLQAGQWHRLRVTPQDNLAAAVVATSAPRTSDPDVPFAWRPFAEVMRQAAAVRRLGSAALDLAWVAAGRLDACFDRGLAPWDVAAGALLVREAGGRVTTFDRQDDVLAIRETLAAGAPLHATLCRILADVHEP
jgi:myo-inositol-1(or 4)-monophosphatase